MNRQFMGKCVLALLVLLFSAAAQAQVYYLDNNDDPSRVHYRTAQEACVTGQIEATIQGYRATETNSNVRYRAVSTNIGPDDGLGERECQAVIERTYANIWVTVEIIDTLIYGPNGNAPACNIGNYSDPNTGQCGSPKCTIGTANCCDVCSNGTNPIHTASGNKFERETDYVGAGLYPLVFDRTYNSNATIANQPIPFGMGWSHHYASYIVPYPSVSGGGIDTVIVYRSDGRILTFTLNGSTWQSDPDVTERLVALTDSWQITTPDDVTELYDAEGRLLSLTSREGYVQTLSYNDTTGHPRNQVQKVTDPQGHTLSFGYDSVGRLSTVKDGSGQTFTYGYDASNNLASTIYPMPGSTTVTRSYLYNESGQTSGASQPQALTGLVDEASQRYASWGYTADGRANLSVHGAYTGGTIDRTSLAFNSNGTTAITDALGQTRNFGFNVTFGVARQASLDQPCNYCGNPAKTTTYDANGYPLLATDFNGHVTQYTYDIRGLEDQRVEAMGKAEQRTIATTWNTSFHIPQLTTVSNAQAVATTKTAWVYNTRGQPLAQCNIDPAVAGSYTCAATGTPPTGVRRWTYTYCDTVGTGCPIVGLLLTRTGPRTDLAQTTHYAYYTSSSATSCGTPGAACHQVGDLYQVTDALGHVTTIASYDADGRVTRVTDPNGTNTDSTYTPRGWLATRMVGGATTTFTYTAYGAVQTVKDPDGVTTTFGYDPAHRLTDITDVAGNRIHYTLDALGNKTAEQTYNASSTVVQKVSRTFNALNRLTSVVDGLSHTVLSANYADSYDAYGNVTHTADALGFQQQLGYGGLNRLITTIANYNGADPATKNTTTVVTLDPLDRMGGVKDPTALNTLYTFDGLSNRTKLQSPDSGSSTDTYDAAGNRRVHTDAKSIAATSTYDALDRRIGTTYVDTTLNVGYKYDEANAVTGCTSSAPIGRLTRVIESTVTTIFCYDSRGNLTQKKQVTSTHTDTTLYTYTLANRLSGESTPDQTAIVYAYDTNGRVSGVQVTPAGNSSAPPSVVNTIVWQPFGSLSSYKLGNGQTVTRTYDLNYRLTDLVSPGFTLHLARDLMGDVSAIGNAPGANPATENYQYDPLYRLSSVKDVGTAVASYTYNQTGDRLSKTASGLATGAYLYTTGTHRLISTGTATRANDANGNTTGSVLAGNTYGFGYNGRNRLTVTQLNGLTVGTYTYNALGERIGKVASTTTERYSYDEAGHLVGEYGTTNRDYIWLGDLLVAVIDNTINGSVTTSTVNYVTADQLGTPRAVANSLGTVIWQWAYQGNPFGEAQPTSSTGYVLNLRYPGQYFDAESGTNYNVFRNYEPIIGRYQQSDPIGLAGGISTYAYVGNNPLASTDPLGLDCSVSGGSITCAYPGGGPAFRLPAPAGFPASLGPNDFWYHKYDVTRSIGCADPGDVMQGLINSPTPGNPNPATPGGTPNNAAVPIVAPTNPVTSYLTSDLNTGAPIVVNITGANSAFAPGYVARTVTDGVAHTYGEGDAWTQSPLGGGIAPNWAVNQYIWGGQMSQIIAHSKQQCGCTH